MFISIVALVFFLQYFSHPERNHTVAQEEKCDNCDELFLSDSRFCSEQCKKEFLEKIEERVTNWVRNTPGFNGA